MKNPQRRVEAALRGSTMEDSLLSNSPGSRYRRWGSRVNGASHETGEFLADDLAKAILGKSRAELEFRGKTLYLERSELSASENAPCNDEFFGVRWINRSDLLEGRRAVTAMTAGIVDEARSNSVCPWTRCFWWRLRDK